MTVNEFIFEELIAIGKAEIYNGFEEPEAYVLMARHTTLLGPKHFGKYGRMLNIILDDPDFSRLKNVLFMASQLKNVKQEDYSNEAYQTCENPEIE